MIQIVLIAEVPKLSHNTNHFINIISTTHHIQINSIFINNIYDFIMSKINLPLLYITVFKYLIQ